MHFQFNYYHSLIFLTTFFTLEFSTANRYSKIHLSPVYYEQLSSNVGEVKNGNSEINVRQVDRGMSVRPLLHAIASPMRIIARKTEIAAQRRSKGVVHENEKTETPQRSVSGHNTDIDSAIKFLKWHDIEASKQCHRSVLAEWNFSTNITEENKQKLLLQSSEFAKFQKSAWRNATSFAWKQFDDPLIRRWFKSLSILGKAALSPDKLRELNEIIADMENVYSTAKICPFRINGGYSDGDKSNETAQCNLTLEPDLQRIIGESRDYNELLHVWKAFRDNTGKNIRNKYVRYVQLSNEAAKLNGFVDTGELWRQYYESETFLDDLESLWLQLKPLYEHLHAYVRKQLIKVYGTSRIKSNGPIPAHLLGNMWAQTWRNLQDMLLPYPEKPSIDVTTSMVKKNITALDMFKISEDFFTSLGLKPMPDDFWKRSIITKPENREIVCHASAWDFCNSQDVRIKQCTSINMRDLVVTHHEMGHIEYFLQYAKQPFVFREGANAGFHEAVGDVLALSVSIPNHLKKIGLLDEVANDDQGDLNYLMALALDKIAFLPSAYLMDLWRWKVFSDEINEQQMNEQWWAHRVKYQGVCAPIRRSESDFDAGAKYHIAANVPYIRYTSVQQNGYTPVSVLLCIGYFVSYVIQFQFHKSLCEASGHKGELHKCDIYRSKEAGHLLSKTLEKGSSIRWQDAMKIITNGKSDRMDAGPLLEYFDPLFKYLRENLKREHIGWVYSENNVCP